MIPKFCVFCKEDLKTGEIVMDFLQFNCHEGVFDGNWLASASTSLSVFRSEEDPNLRGALAHKSCLKVRLSGMYYSEVRRGLPPNLFGG